jgi:NAD(P)-dependent dehydrogenase (short-subunit alcohol dehydrogenase family)
MTQTVLITGASSGIGAELARSYAREGARLVLLARRRDRLEELAAEARAAGAAEVEVHEADVTCDGDVARAVAGLQSRGIGLDIVYANAGFGVAGMMQRLTIADYQRQLDTNVIGLLRTVYETLPGLRAARGRLVLIGSVAASRGIIGSAHYNMVKAAQESLSRSIALEYGRHGVCANTLTLGPIDGERLAMREQEHPGVRAKLIQESPLKRLPTDAQVADIITFFCSDYAAPINGATLDITCAAHLSAR